jgi:hypothetical protein
MTLRDQFAMAALAGTFARSYGFDTALVVRDAYEAADLMLRERERSPEERKREADAYRAQKRREGWDYK